MDKYIVIEAIGSVSALGADDQLIFDSLKAGKCHFQQRSIGKETYPLIPIHSAAEEMVKNILQKFPKYKKSDRTAVLAILASEICFAKMGSQKNAEWIINAGSSRGATNVWETSHSQFIEHQKVPVKSSPLTTLGNISTHVAQHHKIQGMQIDHSITCSSGLQALANAYAWLRSGLSDHFLALGTESALTDFTIAQMAALGIYSKEKDAIPCKPCAENPDKTNTFLLGEAAVAIALSNKSKPTEGDLILAGMGTGSETLSNPTSISPYGDGFRQSMLKAIGNARMQPDDIDMIIPHSPGTYQGDMAEYNAIQSVFGDPLPKVINHKFLTGHTLGASGLLSVELGYHLMTKNLEFNFPYPALYPQTSKLQPQTVLINSMGFGGNSVSIILKKV